MSLFVCPVCGGELERTDSRYVCPKRHSFDISAKGYVNLLTADKMNSKIPGDNKMMVAARADFLGKGYYSHLAEAVSRTAAELFTGGVMIDAGCGEGYYTERIYKALRDAGHSPRGAAIDISKFACARAARRFKEDSSFETAAASVFHMPVRDMSADMLVSMFAPFCGEEFIRVIKKGGCLIMAIPAENHLMSLKEAVYDKPYKNETADYKIEGFSFIKSEKVSEKIFIDNNADIQSLFSMTPYYYKTGREGHERIKMLGSLETEAAFEILTYRKD